MKATARNRHPRESPRPTNRKADVEIQSFLQAIDSYPERFSREPEVSFAQHLISFDKRLDKGKDSPVG